MRGPTGDCAAIATIASFCVAFRTAEVGAPKCHALTPRGKAFPHEEAAPVAHRLSSFMVPFALVNPVRTTR